MQQTWNQLPVQLEENPGKELTRNDIRLSWCTNSHLGVISTIEFHIKDEAISSDGVTERVRRRSDIQSHRAIKPVKLIGNPSIPASTEWRGKWDFNLSHLIKLSISLIPTGFADTPGLICNLVSSCLDAYLSACLFVKKNQGSTKVSFCP